MEQRKLFQISDIGIARFILYILVIQLAFLTLSFSYQLNFDLSFLRIPVSLLYLNIVPGILVLRIMKVKNLDISELLLYTIGLSIFILMFIGFIVNITYPLIGIKEPISFLPLILTITSFVLILLTICFSAEKNKKGTNGAINYESRTPQYRFPCPRIVFAVILGLSIFGKYILNTYQANIVAEISLLAISASVVFIVYNFKHLKSTMPFLVFLVSLSLLYYYSLTSPYLTGYDIHIEYYLADLVKSQGYWTIGISEDYNAMLSLVILPNVYSTLSGMPLIEVFKIIYPIIYSLVPVGLYRIYSKQVGYELGFLSVFFFMSIFPFYLLMPTLARQQIAEFFVVLMIMLITGGAPGIASKFLTIVFGFSLIVSHYGTSYLYLFIMILSWSTLTVVAKMFPNNNIIIEKITKKDIMTHRYILLFATLTLAWYMYISNAAPFINAVSLLNQMSRSLGDLLNPKHVQGLQVIIDQVSPLRQVTKYLNIFAQFLIVTGFTASILSFKKSKISSEYLTLSLGNMMILFLCLTVPIFAATLSVIRMYQIAIIALAPFMVIGWFFLGKALCNHFHIELDRKNHRIFQVILSCFLAIFLLFNSGFFYEVFNDNPNVIALNYDIDAPRFYEPEFFAGKWMKEYTDSKKVFADEYGWLLLSEFMRPRAVSIFNGLTRQQEDSYVFLRMYNIREKKLLVSQLSANRYVTFANSVLITTLHNAGDKVYDSNAMIYYIRR